MYADLCWLVCKHYGLNDEDTEKIWVKVRDYPAGGKVHVAVQNEMRRLGLWQDAK